MTKWTDDELSALHSIATQTSTNPKIADFRRAASKLKKSVSSCETKFARMDWNKFFKGDAPVPQNAQPWSKLENMKLYELKTVEEMDYKSIGEVLRRTPISCERQFQRMDWKSLIGNKKSLDKEIVKEEHKKAEQDALAAEREFEEDQEQMAAHRQELCTRIVDWLVGTVKADPETLKSMDKATFNAKLEKVLANPDSKFSREDIVMSFEEIKNLAMEQIVGLGMAYPKTKVLGKGTYVIVGDSHGKHTSNQMFDLLKTINEEVKPDYIIHVGHISDDGDEISYRWKEFPNLIVLGMLAELKLLKSQVIKYDVVRKEVKLGNLVITNQYDSGDFVKKSIGKIDPMTLPDMTVLNSHRHEMHSHCAFNKDRIILSPGCLCERHTIRTQKVLIFKDGLPTVRQVHTSGFQKYNKQEQDNARWENGLVIVEVDDEGEASVSPCRIRETILGFTTAFFDKIYGEHEVRDPDKKIFFNADLHCVMHDAEILDIQEQFCGDYQPDVHVNLGDVMDNRALNHHMGGTSGAAFFHNSDGEIEYREVLPDVGETRFVMARMRRWAGESFLLIGNHERFASDFALKAPQLAGLLDVTVLLGCKEMGVNVTNLKKTLVFGDMKMVHGDVKVWGGTGGSKMDKIANNYGMNTVMGNIHYPAIRSGCYSMPMSGQLDQQYNEVDASQWMQGFGYANVFDGLSFITIVTVMSGRCVIAGKKYVPRDCKSWHVVPKYVVKIGIDYLEEATWPEMPSGRSPKASVSPGASSKKVGRVRVPPQDKTPRAANKRQ